MKAIVLSIAISMLSVSAFASEYTSADQLPAGSVVEAMFDVQTNKVVCPKDQHPATKYCWNKKAFRFKACGKVCVPNRVPPSRH